MHSTMVLEDQGGIIEGTVQGYINSHPELFELLEVGSEVGAVLHRVVAWVVHVECPPQSTPQFLNLPRRHSLVLAFLMQELSNILGDGFPIVNWELPPLSPQLLAPAGLCWVSAGLVLHQAICGGAAVFSGDLKGYCWDFAVFCWTLLDLKGYCWT